MKHSTTRTGWWGPRKSCANSSTEECLSHENTVSRRGDAVVPGSSCPSRPHLRTSVCKSSPLFHPLFVCAMRWASHLIKYVLMKDDLFREIHERTTKLTPKRSELRTVWQRSKSGNITPEERAYLEAYTTRQMRVESLQIDYLESCYQQSSDLK